MAEVFRYVNGQPIQRAMARVDVVQSALDGHGRRIYRRAKATHARHRDLGHSRIEYSRGTIDRWITLSDERGLRAALSIEFGRGPGRGFPNGTRGIGALTGAIGREVGGARRRGI